MAARAWGVGALGFRPDADWPYRTELRRSRAVVLLRGVWMDRRVEPRDGGSALKARREGVTTVIFEGGPVGVVVFDGVDISA